MQGEPDDGAAIYLVSHLPDPEQAQAQLSAFARENFSMLAGTLMKVRESR